MTVTFWGYGNYSISFPKEITTMTVMSPLQTG